MYIERAKAIHAVEKKLSDARENCLFQVTNYLSIAKALLRAIPAADVAPVVRGCWSLRCDSREDFSTGEYDEDYYLECSECKRKVWDIDQGLAVSGEWAKLIEPYPYCHCGAKMNESKGE